MESTWQVILAIAVAAVLKEVADVIRQWGNKNFQKTSADNQRRMENKIDGNTALTATNLVSSGRLPEAAPCIPAVAKAVSDSSDACASAVDYARTATSVAHEKMATEGIPIQSQELLVDKLHAKLEETRLKEERHAQNNAQWVKVLNDRLDAMKADIDSMKAKPTSGVIKERLDS